MEQAEPVLADEVAQAMAEANGEEPWFVVELTHLASLLGEWLDAMTPSADLIARTKAALGLDGTAA